MKAAQAQFDFEPGITEQFRTLKECLHAVVYSARIGLSGVAAHCDLSPSELQKVLAEVEGRKCDVNLIDLIIEATGDKRPVFYLMGKHLESQDAKRDRAISELAEFVRRAPELLKMAGVKK